MGEVSAAALVIGNELLTGKVCEANVVALARTLRTLGIVLRRVVIVLDDVETIAREVTALAKTHDWLFTSGGVGPTHDDVTIEGVARAFGVPVVSSPEMEAMIRAVYGERCTEGHLRMALMPQGATQEATTEIRWPTLRLENTWIMPGVPEIFRMKLAVVAEKVAEKTGRRAGYVSRAVYTRLDEGDLKPLLDAVVARFPEVEVGSYPKWMDPRYKTKVTFDGRDVPLVEAAAEAFASSLPQGARVEEPSVSDVTAGGRAPNQ